MNKPTLKDDRLLEWTWCIKFMPHNATTLDIGCCDSILPYIGLAFDNKIIGIDLNYTGPSTGFGYNMIRGDFLKQTFIRQFDYIVLCSTLEHIGLAGRYNSIEDPLGDIKTMSKAYGLMKKSGNIALTIPIGKDDIIRPFHKIYGPKYLPMILQLFKIIKQEYWHKADGTYWEQTTQETAFNIQGSSSYYCLGLFLLGDK